MTGGSISPKQGVNITEISTLTKFQLILYEDILDWNRIKANPFIKWSKETKTCFKDRLNEANKHESVLYELEEMVVAVSYQPEKNPIYREDDEEYFMKFWKQIIFGIYVIPVGFNEEALMPLLRKFDCGIELDEDPFDGLPIPTQFIRERKDTLQWDILSRYWGLNWSFELLREFEQYWITDKLINNHTVFNYCLKDDLNDDFIEKVLS